jgi:hypothetical protein
MALLVSVAAHLTLLAFLKVEVPPVPERDRARVTQLIELADVWEDRPLEIVRLSDARTGASSSADVAATASASSVDAQAPDPGADGTRTTLAAFEPTPALAGTAPAAAELSLELAEQISVASVSFKSAQRGVVLRAGGGGPAGDVGLDFEAASDAARNAERRRGGGLGGTGGIGVTIIGGGGDCDTPGSIGVPGISGRAGGIGSLPRLGTGRGLIGRTGGFGSAINRVAPARP